ncbi:LytR family transcriptional regulator [Alteribacter lacisalsi]|uniref:LytR family transcriptional regulator n=1 Tax=Alteribacter lacisalsi TaxID=2045244 RepID=A0A2W0H4F2_9BACI|nr:LCP family protein [Alteribacter lacisalsi]PYZ96713.1 LytR family transcriptional regulator [Alteribacter lacisalsi]
MKKFLLITGGVMLLLILAAGGYGYYLYDSVQETVDSQMHVELERNESSGREGEVNMDEFEPVSFLLIGVDSEGVQEGLSDTMIVVTVNPDEDSMRMVSLPRDTRVEIPGYDMMDKINHAYGFGGPELAIATVENYLDIPLDYFMTVNMDGFEEMVDSVGGVTVENPFAFDQNSIDFEEGELDLNGKEALAYVRMRSEDPRGDMGRNERQRQVVNALVDEGAQFSSITRVESILDAVGSNVVTNLDFAKMRKLFDNYASARHNQDTLEIEGSGETIDGIWYLQVPDEERERVSSELRAHLELDDAENDGVAASSEEDE